MLLNFSSKISRVFPFTYLCGDKERNYSFSFMKENSNNFLQYRTKVSWQSRLSETRFASRETRFSYREPLPSRQESRLARRQSLQSLVRRQSRLSRRKTRLPRRCQLTFDRVDAKWFQPVTARVAYVYTCLVQQMYLYKVLRITTVHDCVKITYLKGQVTDLMLSSLLSCWHVFLFLHREIKQERCSMSPIFTYDVRQIMWEKILLVSGCWLYNTCKYCGT